MSKALAIRSFVGALSITSVMLILGQPANAATAASRAPVCMKVTDTFINGGFLNMKFPAWLFTNHCNYIESFYVQYPGVAAWAPSVKFGAGKSLGFISNGKAAKLVRILECPNGWSAIGGKPNVCYR